MINIRDILLNEAKITLELGKDQTLMSIPAVEVELNRDNEMQVLIDGKGVGATHISGGYEDSKEFFAKIIKKNKLPKTIFDDVLKRLKKVL